MSQILGFPDEDDASPWPMDDYTFSLYDRYRFVERPRICGPLSIASFTS